MNEVTQQMIEYFEGEISSLEDYITANQLALQHDKVRLAKLIKFRDSLSTQPELDLPPHTPTH